MTDVASPLDALRAFVDSDLDADDGQLCRDRLMQRILVLSDYAWERRIDEASVDRWLDNFDGGSGHTVPVERLHALYLLSQFLYFGVREIRVLLQSVYRDLFLIPLIQEVRLADGGTRDPARIERGVRDALLRTRFMGVGNPSESGVHLLYYFRQENGLCKNQFMDTARIFSGSGADRRVTNLNIDRYVFIDDVCGSGQTARDYSEDFLKELRAAKPSVKLSYHCIFATADGIRNVRENSVFEDQAKAIFELDATYRCLSADSRYLKIRPAGINDDVLRSVAFHYGDQVCPGHGGGYEDGQLLLGFSHNIPDNSLPVIWRDPGNGSPVPWTAALRRHMKV